MHDIIWDIMKIFQFTFGSSFRIPRRVESSVHVFREIGWSNFSGTLPCLRVKNMVSWCFLQQSLYPPITKDGNGKRPIYRWFPHFKCQSTDICIYYIYIYTYTYIYIHIYIFMGMSPLYSHDGSFLGQSLCLPVCPVGKCSWSGTSFLMNSHLGPSIGPFGAGRAPGARPRL